MLLHADSEESDQTDLSLRWAHMPFCWFCRAAAHFQVCLNLFYSEQNIQNIYLSCKHTKA